MNHRRLHSPNWTIVLVCCATLGALACGGDRKTTDSGAGGGGLGGAGTGGMSQGGNGGGSGGADAGPGGISGSGGAGGITSTGNDASIGTGSCTTDAECVASGLVCEPVTHHCAQCAKTADCPAGQHCRANVCASLPTPCTTSLQCSDKVCDPARGLCVACATSADCISAPGLDCVANTCVAATTCQTSLDCGTKVCDAASKKCVDCASDNDCNALGATTTQHCIKNLCKPECISDKQCTPQGMLCDPTLKVCAQCKANKDCPDSSFCEGGQCKPDVCDSTEAMCSGNGVAQCNAAGSGWGAVSNCPASNPCKASGGAAGCGGPPLPIDGGTLPLDGGIGTIDGASLSCTTATFNPCTGIPKFEGVQTVDGKDDDLCQLPSFSFIKPSAAVVNNYNNIQDSEFPVVTAKVAWSTAGLHTFFAVADVSVQSVAMKDPSAATQKPYQGDSIELYFTSNDSPSGVPGGDPGAVHVTLSATGPSVSVRTTNANGISTTYAELPAAQYKAVKTSTGYAIEALIPWAGGAPSASSRVRFDLAVNCADTNCSGVDDMRDAQIVLYQSNVTGQTACPGGAEAWCDDRTWCATTLQP